MHSYKREEAFKVLQMLEEYQNELQQSTLQDNSEINSALQKLIRAVRARLFTALTEILEFYHLSLIDPNVTSEDKIRQINNLSIHWQQGSLPPVKAYEDKYPEPNKLYNDYLVEMNRKDGDLGLSIVGGLDSSEADHDHGIYISKILINSLAYCCNQLNVYDRLLEVNGINIFQVTHSRAVEVLKSQTNSIHLLVRRYTNTTSNYSFVTIAIVKTNDNEMGFDIQYIDKSNQSINGIFITSVLPSITYQSATHAECGDQIVEINNVNIENASYETAIEILTQSDIIILLKVKRFLLSNVEQNASVYTNDIIKGIILKRGPDGYGMNIIGGDKPSHGVFISHITPNGPADMSNLINCGDKILEVNGHPVTNSLHEEVAHLFRSAQESVYLTIQHSEDSKTAFKSIGLSSICENKNTNSQGNDKYYVRAHYDFTPPEGVNLAFNPLTFNEGDILFVVNDSDREWWQAYTVDIQGKPFIKGVIPSKESFLQDKQFKQKTVRFSEESTIQKLNNEPNKVAFGRNSSLRFIKRIFPVRKASDQIENEIENDIRIYSKVEKKDLQSCRPILLLGPLKDQMNDMLVQSFPDSFAGCIPHTTRPPRLDETDCVDYYFISEKDMNEDINLGRFIEAGKYNGNLYGTTVKAVRDVIENNRHCILGVSGHSILRLIEANLYPIAICIYPSRNAFYEILADKEQMPNDFIEQQLQLAEEVVREFGPYLAGVARGRNISEIFFEVRRVIDENSNAIVWEPITN